MKKKLFRLYVESGSVRFAVSICESIKHARAHACEKICASSDGECRRFCIAISIIRQFYNIHVITQIKNIEPYFFVEFVDCSCSEWHLDVLFVSDISQSCKIWKNRLLFKMLCIKINRRIYMDITNVVILKMKSNYQLKV